MIGSFYLYFVTLHFPRHLESLLSGPSCLVVVVCVVCVCRSSSSSRALCFFRLKGQRKFGECQFYIIIYLSMRTLLWPSLAFLPLAGLVYIYLCTYPLSLIALTAAVSGWDLGIARCRRLGNSIASTAAC